MTRGQQKSLLASVELKLSKCTEWLDSVKETLADQLITTGSTDHQRQLAQIQVAPCSFN